MPNVSIITINFNNQDGLRCTIESVLAQIYTDYEYIIIDGGSSDKSLDIIKRHKHQITYWISEPDKGIYNAMNKGISKATGKYIYFLNSGDIIYKTTMQKLFSLKDDLLKYQVIYGNIISKDTKVVSKCNCPEKIFYDLPFCHQAVLSLSSLHHRNPFDERYKVAADFDFFLSIYLKKYSFFQTDINFGEIDNNGISNTAFFKTMFEYTLILWRNSKNFNRFINSLTYLWHKKKFIAYLLISRLSGPILYKKMIKAYKSIFQSK